MLETSRDLLNVVLAGAIGLIAIFICWGMWYGIAMLRNLSKVTVSIRKKMETVDKILDLIKAKLEQGSNHLGMLADSAIKLVGYIVDSQKKKSASKKKD